MASSDTEYKIVVLGGGGVGKSALTIRLVTGNFLDEYDPTIEDSYRKQTTIDNKTAILDILDTAGQEEFASMQDQWMREGKGFLLVFNLVDKNTFEELFNEHNGYIQKIARAKDTPAKKIPIVVAGNKCDLKDPNNSSHVQTEDIKKACAEYGYPFFETSAKKLQNHEICFYQVVREIWSKQSEPGGKKKKKPRCQIL